MVQSKVAVLGATGMIGSAVTRQLTAAGHAVTAILRDRETRNLPKGVDSVIGDVADPRSLDAGLHEADVLFVSLSVDPKQGRPNRFNPDRDGLTNVLERLRGRSRPRVLYVASLVQDENPHAWWVLEHKREAVRRLEASGVPHTIFKPSSFMENLPFRNRRGSSIALIGKSRHPNWWVAANDFGKQVAAHVSRLAEQGEHADRASTYAVQGPEHMTYDEAARRYAAAYRASVLKVSHAPAAVFSLLGRFVPELGYAYEISRAINDAPEQFQAEQSWRDLGRPTTTIEHFAQLQR
jgi:uncharacterized protein YbjT (DUF2867 family)